MKKGLIIFDFDGVLADSFDNFFSLIRDSMESIGLSLTPNQYRNLFVGNIHQGFSDFIHNESGYKAFSKFRKNNYDKYYYNKHHRIKLFSGAIEFLKDINKYYILSIASSGKEYNIKDLLEENGIKNLFATILANSATSKEGMIKDILDKSPNALEKTFFITDTVGDIKVAKKCGLKTVAITWGFHSKKMLKSAKPDFTANSFKEVEKIFI